jgi:formylglycine-generating enzyme required for sulfatase activity
VGQKKPNELGLYDLSGNVWELCSDWHGAYPPGTVIDPTGPAQGSYYVLRGGGWYDKAENYRVALRGNIESGHRDNNIGFRLVAAPALSAAAP